MIKIYVLKTNEVIIKIYNKVMNKDITINILKGVNVIVPKMSNAMPSSPHRIIV